MINGISIIICCYNSANRLPETIAHIAKQNIDFKHEWELIIIDNASTDNTIEIAIAEFKKYNLKTPLRTFHEPQPGLSYARKRGIMESLYNYVIFCDDDNWLFDDYLSQAFETINNTKDIGAIGGIGIPEFEEMPPKFIYDFTDYFATGAQANSDDLIDITKSKKYVYGAAAVFNKQALLEIYNDQASLFLSDRKGESLVSGGDNEICYRLIMKGYKIFYNPKMKFFHFLPKNRLTQKYLLALNYSFGYSYCLLLPYLDHLNNITRNSLKRWPLWLSLSLLKTFFLKHSKTLLKNKRKITDIHLLMTYYYDLGMLVSSFENFGTLQNAFKFVKQQND